ncbi:hypothetical protein ACTXT7_003661 [Hymenolepis weldensis]
MNFGNFFRNISVDKQNANSGGGGGLLGAPGRLLESINAKTESIVSDFSQKVDIGGKIDTLKKYSNIDKIGQTVLGTTFQSRPTDEAGHDKSQTVPDQIKRDSVSQPQSTQPFHSMQFGDEMTKIQAQAAQNMEKLPSNIPFEQISTQQIPPQEHKNEKTDAWPMSSIQSQTASIVSEKPATQPKYQDYSNQFNSSSDTPSYEYHPTRGYSFQSQQSQDRNIFTNQQSQEEFTTDNFKKSIDKKDFKSREMSSKDTFFFERNSFSKKDDWKAASVKESSFGGHVEQKNTPPTWSSQSKDSFSADMESFKKSVIEQPSYSKDRTAWPSQKSNSYSVESGSLNRNDSQPLASDSIKEENRHENPFNKGMSFDTFSDKKESSFKRQNTTPGSKPPRPPPPRSRSGSQSFQSSKSVSLEEDPVKPSASIAAREKPSEFEEETKKPEVFVKKKSFESQSSNEEIGYLTRLQCQEIVSAVDDMIAGAINETSDFIPPKHDSFKKKSSISRDYWGDSVSEEPAYHQTQNYEKNSYYVTEPDDSRNPDCESGNTMPSDYRLPYEEEKNEGKYPYEQEKKDGERNRTNQNMDDYYTKYDDQQRKNFEEAEEEIFPSISKEVEFQEPTTQTEDQLKLFMMEYVKILVTGDEGQLDTVNEAFKEHVMTPKGRELFSKAIELEGACSGGLLDERGLRAVLSRVVFVLTECQKTEDFVPAKRLLTTSLVYHITDPLKAGEKVFLFSYIKSQPIWHSLRFWNACFFQSVQETRAKMMDQMKSDMEIEQALIGQIK